MRNKSRSLYTYKDRGRGNRLRRRKKNELYPKGQLTINILKEAFGDLFYRTKDNSPEENQKMVNRLKAAIK